MNKRSMLRWLDRPGGRWALQALTNAIARQKLGPNSGSVRWDGQMWLHRCGSDVFPDFPYYDYSSASFSRWPTQALEWEQNARSYWFHVYQPKFGDVIVDVGAGRGEDTFAFSRAVGPQGRVLAVEAHPETFLYLRKMVEYNRLDNVRTLNLAVTDAPGEVFISTGPDWVGNTITGVPSAGGYKVPADSLDNLLDREGLSRVDFLKMNIEGAEAAALRGLVSSQSRISSTCIACHDFLADSGAGDHLRTRAGVIAELQQMGFSISLRDDAPEPWVRSYVYGVRTPHMTAIPPVQVGDNRLR